jgi:glycosyltransferase involved in cell wall biosynthesis
VKILFISNYYPPHFEGGYEISVMETAKYLSEHGHEIYILTGIKGVENNPDTQISLKPDTPYRIFKYIDYRHGGYLDKHQVEKFNYKIVQTALMQLQPDIVYLGNMKAISIAPVIAVQNKNVKHVFDLGDLWPNTYINQSYSNRINRYLKRLLPFTIGGKIDLNPVIVLSSWMKQEVTERFGSKDVHIVPRGISIPPDTPKELSKPLKYVFLGRIEPMKGLDICIRAFIEITRDYPEFEFTFDVIGEEDLPYADLCRKLIETNGLSNRISFKGKTNNALVALQDYDVMLMPTLAREAFGRVIIEAMACKCIVAASDAYGPSEIITDGVDGFLFTPGSVSALVQVIHILNSLSAIEIAQIRTNARNTVCSKYEISLVKERIEDILVNIVFNHSNR